MADDIVCDPPVRTIPQFDQRWGAKVLHDTAHWKDSGCHPSSIALILRWFAEDCARTKGKFQFPTKDSSIMPPDHYPRRMCEAFWPELAGECAARSDMVAHAELSKKAALAMGMDVKKVSLPLKGDRMATIAAALQNGPISVCMQNPGHFIVIQGIKGGRLLIVDPGNVLCGGKWQDVKQSVGMPPHTQWPGGQAPGYERSGGSYVSVHPTNSVRVLDNGDTVRFLESCTMLEQWICEPSGAAAQPGTQPAKPKDEKKDDAQDGPITEGDYTKVKVQLTGGPATDTVARPTKGTQVVWGGTAAGTPWGHLASLIEKAGGQVSYTFLHGATLQQNQGAVKVSVSPESAAEVPPDPPAGTQTHSQPVPGEKMETQPAATPGQPGQPAPPKKDDPPKKDEPPPKQASPVDPAEPLFKDGKEFVYNGGTALVWAHPKTHDSGPRPLIIYLHGINQSLREVHPSLNMKNGLHMGHFVSKQIDDGKIAPLIMAAPTQFVNKVWDERAYDTSGFVEAIIAQLKGKGVEVDLDQVVVTGHSGGGGYGPAWGMDRVASQHAAFTANGSEHKLKLFGLMDTQFTENAAKVYNKGLKDNPTTVLYAVHAGGAGWPDGYATHPTFAKALGLEASSGVTGGVETAGDIENAYDNGGASPMRLSIKVKKDSLAKFRTAWKATGGYSGHPSATAHWDLIPMWTWWALPRFFPAGASASASPQPQANPESQAGKPPADPESQSGKPPADSPPPADPKDDKPPADGGGTVTGGELNIPPPPPAWTNPAGDISPKSYAAQFADPTTALYWPVRGKGHPGRTICYAGDDGKAYGIQVKKGVYGAGGRNFLTSRSDGRAHVGIDVYGDFGDVVVACENGTVKNWYHFYHGVYCLIVQCDSGLVINYGEVDAGSLKDFKLKIGAQITAGQPIAKVGRMSGGDSMLHFETYPSGTTSNQRHYFKDGDSDLKRFKDPTQYLLSLARLGK